MVNPTQVSSGLSELGPMVAALLSLLFIAWVIGSEQRTRRLVQLIRAMRKGPPAGGTSAARRRTDRK